MAGKHAKNRAEEATDNKESNRMVNPEDVPEERI